MAKKFTIAGATYEVDVPDDYDGPTEFYVDYIEGWCQMLPTSRDQKWIALMHMDGKHKRWIELIRRSKKYVFPAS